MYRTALALAISIVLLGSRPAALGDQVLTIYFCGTGSTGQMFDGGISSFGNSELVASLWRMDGSESPAEGAPAAFTPRYKTIIDGIGTGSGWALDNLATLDPATLGRGWDECLTEASIALARVLDDTLAEPLILNLVGWSRGGVLCTWMARDVHFNARIRRINILAFDPVPGVADPVRTLLSRVTLPSKVHHYVGIYAEDERSYRFEPMIPDYFTQRPEGMTWIVSVPGSHETIVGSVDMDGKSVLGSFTTNPDLRLHLVSSFSSLVAQLLLRSPAWGGVEFRDPSDLHIDFAAIRAGSGKAGFDLLIDAMRGIDPNLYTNMRRYVFTPLGFGVIGIFGYLNSSFFQPAQRLCFQAPYYDPPIIVNRELVYPLEQRVSSITTANRAEAWRQLQVLINAPPVADAGPDRSVHPDDLDSTVIEGSATDVDEHALAYKWTEDGVDLTVLLPVAYGRAPLELRTLPPLALGTHNLTLVVEEDVPSNDLIQPLTDSDTVVVSVTESPRPEFHRGDPNVSGDIDISDGIAIFGHLFLGDPRTLLCRESADANNDGAVDISDGVYVLSWLFTGGPEPPAPGPAGRPCGVDPDMAGSLGDLGCVEYPPCP